MRTWPRAVILGLALLVARDGAAAAAEPIRVRGMTFVSVELPDRHLVVRAERAEIDPGAEVARLEGVTVDLSGEEAGGVLTLRCDRARVALAGDAFRLDGDVRGRDARGRRFRTDWLEFDGPGGRLHTDASVTVVDGLAEYRGGALVYDLETRRLRLSDGTRVIRGGDR